MAEINTAFDLANVRQIVITCKPIAGIATGLASFEGRPIEASGN